MAWLYHHILPTWNLKKAAVNTDRTLQLSSQSTRLVLTGLIFLTFLFIMKEKMHEAQ